MDRLKQLLIDNFFGLGKNLPGYSKQQIFNLIDSAKDEGDAIKQISSLFSKEGLVTRSIDREYPEQVKEFKKINFDPIHGSLTSRFKTGRIDTLDVESHTTKGGAIVINRPGSSIPATKVNPTTIAKSLSTPSTPTTPSTPSTTSTTSTTPVTRTPLPNITPIDPFSNNTNLSSPQLHSSNIKRPRLAGPNNIINTQFINSPQSEFDLNYGQLANAANLVNNLSTINSYETNIDLENIDAPRFTYKDRTGLRRRSVQNAATSARKGIERTGGGNNTAVASNILAQQLNAENIIHNEEATREENARNRFQQSLLRTNAINASINNEEDKINLQLRNSIRSERASAYDSYLRGVVGNLEQQEQLRQQQNALNVIYSRDRGRGVVNRFRSQTGV